ncbi:vesicle-associated protein 3-1-like isoform X2 [Tasmannia lanceolata]|uniref:vesicle-associated protein 3-1-like isoform X2 n=1 Tax=Tasmannia lanceolata TaxID=3420 RepID=UPI004062B244
MSPELLEIQPRELKFTLELKKQSSCSVQLVNKSDQYVAFKVKTTCPKRYSVRPNTDVILPKSTCNFTVTMQAQKTAPPDKQLKDKFLIQCTVVPFGSTMEDVTSNLFTKENGRYIEENKLRVVLVSPPHSPVLLPINGAMKQEPAYETAILRDQLSAGVEDLPPSNHAEKTITELREERITAIQERDALQKELALMRRKRNVKVQVGFPFLFVCFIALVSMILGYMLGA